jgi:hypothetical protein
MQREKDFTDFNNEQKELLKKLLIALCFLIGLLTLLHIDKIETIEETTKAFKNSEVLVCHNTLIVSDANWKLVDDHLINTNSAGYLLIDGCRIKEN